MTAPRPLIATPCYGGMLCVNYVTSVLRLCSAFERLDMPAKLYFHQDSLITRARNHCVETFLTSDCTHLFFIDADIGFEPAAAVRLMKAGHDVAAGIYPIKHEGAGFPIDLAVLGHTDADGFAEAHQAPTGFMCISREVFERMIEAGIHRHELFDTMRDGDEYLSEDYAFCRRWRDLGGMIHVDMRSDLSHQGVKLYRGTLQSAWRAAA